MHGASGPRSMTSNLCIVQEFMSGDTLKVHHLLVTHIQPSRVNAPGALLGRLQAVHTCAWHIRHCLPGSVSSALTQAGYSLL